MSRVMINAGSDILVPVQDFSKYWPESKYPKRERQEAYSNIHKFLR